jgi:hypothetical protein
MTAATVMITSLAEDFGGGAQGVSWLAGANPNNAVLLVASRAMVITGLGGVVMVPNATAAKVVVKNGVVTNIHSGTGFDAAAAAGAQNLTSVLTTTALAAGDYLYLSSADTFAASVAMSLYS